MSGFGFIRIAVWVLIGCLGLANVAGAQPFQTLLYLRDKAQSNYTLEKPQRYLSERAIARRQRQHIPIRPRDVPVSESYLHQLRQLPIRIRYTSRWLNAVLIETDSSTLARCLLLPFVQRAEPQQLMRVRSGKFRPVDNASARLPAADNTQTQRRMLGLDAMHQDGFRGETMWIALLDAGFQRANQLPLFTDLFSSGRLLGTYDFIDSEVDVFDDHPHGTQVLSTLAGLDGDRYAGAAPAAHYLLLRSEDAGHETPIEEFYWLRAAEYADSVGVDIISSSLGYSGFDNPLLNHTYSQLNGQTALSSRAAQIATECGMVVVSSAGNEGNTAWQYISAPADAVGVLSVGAVDANGRLASFSSTGPSADGRIKPDLVALGVGVSVSDLADGYSLVNGTSFSAPLVAGLAAGLWQAHPMLSAAEITQLLRRSGSQANTPDNTYGYGIPAYGRATALAADTAGLYVFPNPITDDNILTLCCFTHRSTTSPQPIRLTLTDISGRARWQQTYSYPQTPLLPITLPPLSPGWYGLTIQTPTQRNTLRVIKK